MLRSENEKKLVIRKSNELIEARYKLSVSEQRFILLLASEISPDDEDFKDYEISVNDFARMFELKINGSLYQDIERTALSLMKQTITFRNKTSTEAFSWLSYIRYVNGSGVVQLRFDKALKPYLLQLKNRYTQYQLNFAVKFKSQYSIRLYELLKMDSFKANNGKFERVFKISELREVLDIEAANYPVFADFRRDVLEPSINDISNKTDLTITAVDYRKTGRKITSATFVVITRTCPDDETKVMKDQNVKPETNRLIEASTPNKKSKKSDDCPVINALVAYGISPSVANTIKNTHDIEKINRNIAYAVAKNQAGEIKKNFAGYLNSAIEKDYGAVQASLFDVVSIVATKSSTNSSEKEVNEKERMEQALHNFSLLSQNRQEEIQRDFLGRSCNDAASKILIKQTNEEGKSFYSHPIIKFRFLQFIITNKIC